MNKNDLFRSIGEMSDDLIQEAERPERRVRRLRRPTVFAVAAAIILTLGMSVFAVSGRLASRITHTFGIPDYYSVPARQTLCRQVGFELNLVDEFSNGYRFKNGSISSNEDKDESGAVLERYKGLKCVYVLAGENLLFSVDAAAAGNDPAQAETAEIYRGSALRYYAYTDKMVPPNYVMNGQDRLDEANSVYVFSYGSKNIEIHAVQGLNFAYGGLNYDFCAIDSGITKDELVQMAKELIDAQG